MSEMHDPLMEELRRATKNLRIHLGGRAHWKHLGPRPAPGKCGKCLRTLQRVAEATRSLERREDKS